MKVSTEYVCEVCNTKHTNEKDALQCETNHSLCHCKKNNKYNIYWNVIAYGKAIRGFINFENSTIDIHLDDDDFVFKQNITEINYCPFCGEKLGESTEVPKYGIEIVDENYYWDSVDECLNKAIKKLFK